MRDLDRIVEFSVSLGSCLLQNGANLERVNDTLYRICYNYGLKEVSLFSLNTTLILSAKDRDGAYCSRHTSIAATGIHLGNLRSYNDLARKVCIENPDPKELSGLLRLAGNAAVYPTWLTLLGFILALGCICLMFNGTCKDVICVSISTTAMFFIIRLLNLPNLNRIIKDAICMLAAGLLAKFYMQIGLGSHYETIILTNGLMIVPGIQMVNATRNIICGNELNGIIEMIKVILETLAIVVGLAISMYLWGVI